MSIDSLLKTTTSLPAFRRCEVEAIRDGDRPGADTNDVARGFGNDQLRTFTWIRSAVAAISIERHRQRATRFLDSHHCGVSARQHRRVGPDHVIVLAIDQLLGSEIGSGEKLN